MATQTPNMGLTKWDLLSDVFSHTQLALNFNAIDLHDHSAGKGVPIVAGGLAAGSVGTVNLQNLAVTTAKLANLGVTTGKLADGSVTTGKLAGSIPWNKLAGTNVQSQLGVNDGTTVSRGASIIDTVETRNSLTFSTLATPDQVTNVVLPTNGLILVQFMAHCKVAPGFAHGSETAIFIDSEQLRVGMAGASPVTQAGILPLGSTANKYQHVVSGPFGLAATNATLDATNVSTGQVAAGVVPEDGGRLFMDLGGTEYTISSAALPGEVAGYGGTTAIFADAGTYDVSIRMRASGTGTWRNRKLWVSTIGF